MFNYLQLGSGLIFVLFFGGCASSMVVESSPDNAEILMRRENDVPLKIGKTPMTLTREVAPGIFSDSVELYVAKDGYQVERILIPQSRFGVRSRWSVSLQPSMGDGKNLQSLYTGLAQGIAEAQKEIYLKNYRQAETKISTLLARYPNVSVLYDLLGNIYYMQKDLDKALDAYRRSVALTPDNHETSGMIDKIARIRGEKTGG
ncbi:MAG: hypothetical protein A2583_03870 [Bdellovibrionales bacterium RIFOXYD1_FULL_53_11]|nr:MAG: hypothetical protein A2583_03870 [Bdellovibrionales bacterium RIFOXYD1_FULL_53_11]